MDLPIFDILSVTYASIYHLKGGWLLSASVSERDFTVSNAIWTLQDNYHAAFYSNIIEN
jgi:hypothetical protein